MNVEAIDNAFVAMIFEKGIETKLGVTRNNVYQLRNRVKNGPVISTDIKLALLKKDGWREDDATFTRKDLVSLVNFVLKTSAKAKEFGAEYVIEKWEKAK